MLRTATMLISTAFLVAACSKPAPLLLVTPEEAKQPSSRGVTLESSQGPVINIVQPSLSETVSNPFSIQVSFKSNDPKLAVNMSSLKLTYKKLWGIDITDRIKDYIDGNRINVPETELPTGEHTLEIYIEDSGKNISKKLITLEIAKSSN